jgi:hypothetical protein
MFFVWWGCSSVLALARRRRVRRASPTLLPESRTAALDSVATSGSIPQGSIRTTLILTPVLPAILIVGIAYWMYRACDEFIRLRILKCVVLTALAVAFGTLAYFVLELFGFPRLCMLAVNLYGWSMFNLMMIYVIIRAR